MLYEYQYDVAALCATLLLLIIYFMRRSYETKSTKVFIIAVVVDFAAALFDVISCYTISFHDKVSIAFNYFVSLSYLFCYNMMSTLFLIYIDAKSKIPNQKKPVKIVAYVTSVFYFVIIYSSPWTHLVAYFDENGNYHHGPLLNVLYTIPFVIMIWEGLILYQAKKRFSKYQVIASVNLIVLMSFSISVQFLKANVLIGPLNIAFVLFFVYMAYENPAYYSFRETPCLNRKAFFESVKVKLRKKNGSLHLMGVSVQDYKYIRHIHGTQYAEELAAKIAEALYLQFRKNAFCIREDKFAIIIDDRDEIEKVRQRVDEIIGKTYDIRETKITPTAQITMLLGLSGQMMVEDAEDLIAYKMDNPEETSDSAKLLETFLSKKHYMEQLNFVIKDAIEKDRFEIYYQPIYHTKTKSYESAEALIRLFDTQLGFINPEEMITYAEDNGLIDQVGEIVFRKVCQFIKNNDLTKKGIKYIEINLSPLQCMQENLLEEFSEIMEEYEIDPSWINLEVTETAKLANEKTIITNIYKLHERGIEFSIDDFGSGFAATDYLIKLPVSIVKIDKSILWGAMKSGEAMIVLQNTMRMIQDLGKEIVVEGVEDEEMVKVLEDAGCDYLQGYYYSRPIPGKEFVTLLSGC